MKTTRVPCNKVPIEEPKKKKLAMCREPAVKKQRARQYKRRDGSIDYAICFDRFGLDIIG